MTFDDLVTRTYDPQPIVWKGRYIDNWFSNFHAGAQPIQFSGLSFQTIEAAYQAAKWTDQARRALFQNLDASQSKKEGRRKFPPIRPDWEQVAIAAMDNFVRQKFQPGTPELERLMRMDVPPVEVNNWNDRRWGVEMDWTGKNALGLILSVIRWEYARTGMVLPGAEEPDWQQRQIELIPMLNRVGPAATRAPRPIAAPPPPQPEEPTQASFAL